MIQTYTINQRDIPDGYYFEVGAGRICEAYAALQHRDEWTPMIHQRVAIVQHGIRILVDADDWSSRRDWPSAMQLAAQMPEKGYGDAQLPTRIQCIEIHKARFRFFDRINDLAIRPSDFTGDIWTRDEADDPDLALRFAYVFDMGSGNIARVSKLNTFAVRFIWEF